MENAGIPYVCMNGIAAGKGVSVLCDEEDTDDKRDHAQEFFAVHRAGDGDILRPVLRGSDALLRVPDPDAAGGRHGGVADLLKLLGM